MHKDPQTLSNPCTYMGADTHLHIYQVTAELQYHKKMKPANVCKSSSDKYVPVAIELLVTSDS